MGLLAHQPVTNWRVRTHQISFSQHGAFAHFLSVPHVSFYVAWAQQRAKQSRHLRRHILAGMSLTWSVNTCPGSKYSLTSSVWVLLCRWDNASPYPSMRLLAMHSPPSCWHFPAQPVWTHRAIEAPLRLSVSMADKEVSHPLIYSALLLLCLAILLVLTPIMLVHKALCVHPAHGGLYK